MTPALRRLYDSCLVAFALSVVFRRAALGSGLSLEGGVVAAQGVLVLALTWIHALARGGLRNALALAFSAMGISLAAEWIGASRGWIFGSYGYSDVLGWRIAGQVPLMIPLAWYLLAYLAHAMTRMALPRSSGRGPRIFFAASALCAWDFLLEPICVASGAWDWVEGGAYFGRIPLSNFAGWFGVSAAIFALSDRLENAAAGQVREDWMATHDRWRYSAPVPMCLALTTLLVVFAVDLGRVGEALVGALVTLPYPALAALGWARRCHSLRAHAATP